MSCGRSPRFRAMIGSEPKTTLREFRELAVVGSYSHPSLAFWARHRVYPLVLPERHGRIG
jgi:hypothetical protein